MQKCIDTSAYEPNINWSNVPANERPAFGIHRATFSNYYTDPYLDDYFAQWKSLGMKRGCYMVLWSDANPTNQVAYFHNIVQVHLNGDYGELNPVLDVEDSNLSFSQVLIAVNAIKDKFGVYPIIYTAYYVWKDIVGSNDVSQISSKCDLWMAQYNTIPNLVPINWSTWAMWQYTERGKITGISYDVDLNYIADWYYDEIMGTTPPTGESWFDGAVTYLDGWTTGISGNYFKYHITKIAKNRVKEMFVTPAPLYPRTTGYVADSKAIQVLSNGGEAIYTSSPALPKGQSVSNGVAAPLAPLSERFLSMQFDKNKNFLGFLVNKHTDCWWAVGVSDILLYNGVVPAVFDTEEADPRSTLFWNETHWMFIHVDGRNNGTPGCRLREVADFARGLGMLYGGNLDGGDSSTLIYNDGTIHVKNSPPEGYQHALADHIGFTINGGITMPTTAGLAVNITQDPSIKKTMTIRTTPGAVAGSDTGRIIATGVEFYYINIVPDTLHPDDTNYQWFELSDAEGNSLEEYVNYYYPTSIYPTFRRATILQEPTEPPAGTLPTINMHFEAQGYPPLDVEWKPNA